jgi:alkylation response protein AidB-like acyl-CoA dehydrogenase
VNYRFSELQDAIAGLASEVVGKHAAAPESADCADGERSRFNATLWRHLGETGLLGAGLSESAGGMGGRTVETCLLLEQIGLHAASAPAWAGLVAANAIDRFGSPDLRDRWVAPFARADVLLTTAFRVVDPVGPGVAPLMAQSNDGAWRLDGAAPTVPIADRAGAVLLAAGEDSDRALYLIQPSAAQVTLRPQLVTSGDSEFELVLDGAPADRVCDYGPESPASKWLTRFALTGLCALEAGLAMGAVRLTAGYVTERCQFGRPLASMQSVQHRLVDAYISAEAMRWTMWHAATELDAEADAVDIALAVATTWAADAGAHVLTAAQHLHGGMGVDLGYPFHRYYLESKRTELMIGSASASLERLGDLEAARASEQFVDSPSRPRPAFCRPSPMTRDWIPTQ